jgi:methionyl-tRNA formyltransferase
MRVIFCTNEDIIGNVAANLFLPILRKHEVKMVLSRTAMLPKSDIHPAMQQLHELEQTQPVKRLFPLLERENDAGEYLTFNQLSEFYGCEMDYVDSLKEDSSVAVFGEFEPDVILSARFTGIFREPHIATAKHGVWNFHSGLLPQYRGVMPTFRAMLNGDKEIGITMHRVTDSKIDVGELTDERRMRVVKHRSMMWHVLKLYPLARNMAADLLERIDEDDMPQAVPYSGKAAYYSAPTAEEVEAFEAKGLRLFDMDEYRELLLSYGDAGLGFAPLMRMGAGGAAEAEYAVAA